MPLREYTDSFIHILLYLSGLNMMKRMLNKEFKPLVEATKGGKFRLQYFK